LAPRQSHPDVSENTVNYLNHLIERCLGILEARPSGIATDIDGTISAIASSPGKAVVAPAAKEALSQLSERLDLIAVVTGRSAADAERMLDLREVVYIGNHGFEHRWRGTSRDQEAARQSVQAIENALAEIENELNLLGLSTGTLFENKRLSASIHYRLSPNRDLIGSDIGRVAANAAQRHGLKLSEGRYVVELRPNIAINKGTAILDLIEDHELKGIIFLGDDVTDVDGFRLVRKATENGLVAGLTIAVASPEARQFVLEEADEVVSSVSEAVELLSAISGRLALSPERS